MDNTWLRDYVAAVQISYFMGDKVVYRSASTSLDVNDHIGEVADHLASLPGDCAHGGTFNIYYKGKRLFAGSGPWISRESILRIAALRAEVGQDIYCMCNETDQSNPAG